MNNVRNERGGKTIMKVIFIIFLLLISTGVAAIAVQIYKNGKQEKRNKEYIQNYPNEIKTYLRDKYGKTFYINPKYETYSGSPIPGKSYTPYTYEIREEDMNGYVFNVRIYPESKYDNKIEEIRDNYCWKFLNIKTKEWFRNELAEILPQDYKFIMRSMYSSADFDNDKNIKPDLPLEAYYKTRTSPVPLRLQIVIPPHGISENTQLTEYNIGKILKDFYNNNPNSKIDFVLLQAKTYEGYKRINERELENVPFFLHKDWINVRDITDLETIMEIEVGQRD